MACYNDSVHATVSVEISSPCPRVTDRQSFAQIYAARIQNHYVIESVHFIDNKMGTNNLIDQSGKNNFIRLMSLRRIIK